MTATKLTMKKLFVLGSITYLLLIPHAFASKINGEDDSGERSIKRKASQHRDTPSGQKAPIKVARTQKSFSPHQGSVTSRKGTTSLSTKVAKFFKEMNEKELADDSNKKTMIRPSTPEKIKNSKKSDQAVTQVESKDTQENLEQSSLSHQSGRTPKKRTALLSTKVAKFFKEMNEKDKNKEETESPVLSYESFEPQNADEEETESPALSYESFEPQNADEVNKNPPFSAYVILEQEPGKPVVFPFLYTYTSTNWKTHLSNGTLEHSQFSETSLISDSKNASFSQTLGQMRATTNGCESKGFVNTGNIVPHQLPSILQDGQNTFQSMAYAPGAHGYLGALRTTQDNLLTASQNPNNAIMNLLNSNRNL